MLILEEKKMKKKSNMTDINNIYYNVYGYESGMMPDRAVTPNASGVILTSAIEKYEERKKQEEKKERENRRKAKMKKVTKYIVAIIMTAMTTGFVVAELQPMNSATSIICAVATAFLIFVRIIATLENLS